MVYVKSRNPSEWGMSNPGIRRNGEVETRSNPEHRITPDRTHLGFKWWMGTCNLLELLNESFPDS